MSSIGTVGIRVIPNLAGFGASVSAAVAGSGSVLARSGAAASLLVSAPIIAGVAASVSQAVSFETALAGVAKTVDAPASEIEKIGQSARDAAKEMPFLREDILSVYEAVGRFGVPVDDIAEVGNMFAKLGVAIPDLAPEKAAEEMVKLFNIMKTPQSEWNQSLDAIVALGNGLPTTEGAIISFSSRLAQARAVVNISEADVLSLSGAFASLNIKPQAGASSISRVFFAMDEAIKGNDESLKAFTDTMGITEEQFRTLFAEDPAELFVQFLEGMDRTVESGASVNGTLDALGLNTIRVKRALLSGAEGIDTVREAMELGNTAYEEQGALQEEFDKRADTTAAKWQVFKNKISDVAVTLGTALLPILLDVMDALEPFIAMIAAAAEAFAALPEPIRQMAAMLLLVLAAAGPILFIVSKLIPMIAGMRAALTLLAANPVVLTLMAIALVALLIIIHWDTLKQWFFAFWEWFYTNWDALWLYFSEKLNELGTWWEETWEGIANFVLEKWLAIKGWWDELIAKIGEIVMWIQDLPEKFATAWDAIKEKVGDAKDFLIAAFAEMGAAADRALGPIDEIIAFGGNLVVGAYNAARGKMAGGPVAGGSSYLVGEKGPELFTPGRSGAITPNNGLGGGVTNNFYLSDVTIRDQRDIVTLAQELAREQERTLSSKGTR